MTEDRENYDILEELYLYFVLLQQQKTNRTTIYSVISVSIREKDSNHRIYNFSPSFAYFLTISYCLSCDMESMK